MATFNFSVGYTPTNELLAAGGFTGATDTPGQVGSGDFSTCVVIGDKDYIPYQTHATTFRPGVKVAHINGIERVDFILNGGKPKSVTTKTLNPDTNTIEYWTAIDPAKLSDGLHEWRAIAYPVAGVPRVVAGGFFNANAGGSLTTGIVNYVDYDNGNDTTGDGSSGNPYKTLMGAAMSASTSGMTTYLKAGDHFMRARGGAEYPLSGNQFWHITAAPGVSQGDVTFDGRTGLAADDGGMFTSKVRMSGITIKKPLNGTPTVEGFSDICWYDTCDFYGPGRTIVDATKQFVENQFDAKYVTDSSFHDAAQMLDGILIYRHITVDHCSGQYVHECPMAIDVVLTDCDREGNGDLHPDLCQYANPCDNVYWEGVVADTTSTVIDSYGVRFNNNAHNVAIIDCIFKVDFPQVMGYGEQEYRNNFIQNCTFSPGFDYDPPHDIENVVFEDCTFLGGTPSATGITVR
jgi:hypothetical protein